MWYGPQPLVYPNPSLLHGGECIFYLSFVFYCDICSQKVLFLTIVTGQEKLMRGKDHLSCGVDWAGCVHSALQRGGMDGGTAAGRPAGERGGTDCPGSAGSSP